MSPSEPETVEAARRRILDYTNDRWEFLEPRLDEFEAAVRRDERERFFRARWHGDEPVSASGGAE
jgi:hypothetical protein